MCRWFGLRRYTSIPHGGVRPTAATHGTESLNLLRSLPTTSVLVVPKRQHWSGCKGVRS